MDATFMNTMNTSEQLKKYINAKRKEKRISITELAELTTVSRKSLSEFENKNDDLLSLPSLIKVCEALDLPLMVGDLNLTLKH